MDYRPVLEALLKLPPAKQGLVFELWPGISGETPEGLKVTARSRKELRRFTNEKDTGVLEWLRSFREGDVFYDIGANVGSITLTAAAMHRDRIQIIAIEPSFSSFESLARNLAINDLLGSTIPLQLALLDRTGLRALNYRSTAAGTSLHAVGDPIDHEGEEFEPVAVQMVPTFRLDDLIEVLQLPVPTRIKIDVDGYEEPLLHGAVHTLSSGTVEELTVEIVDQDRAGTRLASVSELLAGLGYDVAKTFRHGAEDGYVADHLFRRREPAGG